MRCKDRVGTRTQSNKSLFKLNFVIVSVVINVELLSYPLFKVLKNNSVLRYAFHSIFFDEVDKRYVGKIFYDYCFTYRHS